MGSEELDLINAKTEALIPVIQKKLVDDNTLVECVDIGVDFASAKIKLEQPEDIIVDDFGKVPRRKVGLTLIISVSCGNEKMIPLVMRDKGFRVLSGAFRKDWGVLDEIVDTEGNDVSFNRTESGSFWEFSLSRCLQRALHEAFFFAACTAERIREREVMIEQEKQEYFLRLRS